MNTTEATPPSPMPPPPPPPPQPQPPYPPSDSTFSSPLPPKSSHNHPHPESPLALQNHPPPAANRDPREHVPHSLFMNFLLVGISISMQSSSNQASSTFSTQHPLPISFQITALGMVFSLAAFVVSKYMPAGPGHRIAAQAQVLLENIGVFCGVTGFLIDITPCFALRR